MACDVEEAGRSSNDDALMYRAAFASDPKQAALFLRSYAANAYSTLIRFLRLDGALCEYKRILLFHVRRLMHITDERHRIEARKALDDNFLFDIAKQLHPSIDVNTGWTLDGDLSVQNCVRYDHESVENFSSLLNTAYMTYEYERNLERTLNPPPPRRPVRHRGYRTVYNFEAFHRIPAKSTRYNDEDDEEEEEEEEEEDEDEEDNGDSGSSASVISLFRTLRRKERLGRCIRRRPIGMSAMEKRAASESSSFHDTAPTPVKKPCSEAVRRATAIARAARQMRRMQRALAAEQNSVTRMSVKPPHRLQKRLVIKRRPIGVEDRVRLVKHQDSTFKKLKPVKHEPVVVKSNEKARKGSFDFDDGCIYSRLLAEQYKEVGSNDRDERRKSHASARDGRPMRSESSESSGVTVKEKLKMVRAQRQAEAVAVASSGEPAFHGQEKAEPSSKPRTKGQVPVVVMVSQSDMSSKVVISTASRLADRENVPPPRFDSEFGDIRQRREAGSAASMMRRKGASDSVRLSRTGAQLTDGMKVESSSAHSAPRGAYGSAQKSADVAPVVKHINGAAENSSFYKAPTIRKLPAILQQRPNSTVTRLSFTSSARRGRPSISTADRTADTNPGTSVVSSSQPSVSSPSVSSIRSAAVSMDGDVSKQNSSPMFVRFRMNNQQAPQQQQQNQHRPNVVISQGRVFVKREQSASNSTTASLNPAVGKRLVYQRPQPTVVKLTTTPTVMSKSSPKATRPVLGGSDGDRLLCDGAVPAVMNPEPAL